MTAPTGRGCQVCGRWPSWWPITSLISGAACWDFAPALLGHPRGPLSFYLLAALAGGASYQWGAARRRRARCTCRPFTAVLLDGPPRPPAKGR